MTTSHQTPGTADPFQHYEPHDGTAALRNQIVRTRADLGDTISELAARTDVKARAREMASDVRSRASNAIRSRARLAGQRTRGAAFTGAWSVRQGASSVRQGASSVRHGLERASLSPAALAAGAGAGALAGYGVFELLRRRGAWPAAGKTMRRTVRRARRRVKGRR